MMEFQCRQVERNEEREKMEIMKTANENEKKKNKNANARSLCSLFTW